MWVNMVKCLIFSQKQHPYFYCSNLIFMYINTCLNPKKKVFSVQTDQAFNHVHPHVGVCQANTVESLSPISASLGLSLFEALDDLFCASADRHIIQVLVTCVCWRCRYVAFTPNLLCGCLYCGNCTVTSISASLL